jgi:hypothetical protein
VIRVHGRCVVVARSSLMPKLSAAPLLPTPLKVTPCRSRIRRHAWHRAVRVDVLTLIHPDIHVLKAAPPHLAVQLLRSNGRLVPGKAQQSQASGAVGTRVVLWPSVVSGSSRGPSFRSYSGCRSSHVWQTFMSAQQAVGNHTMDIEIRFPVPAKLRQQDHVAGPDLPGLGSLRPYMYPGKGGSKHFGLARFDGGCTFAKGYERSTHSANANVGDPLEPTENAV